MNLIEKWKNRETKKKLKEENIRLKAQLEANLTRSFPVMTVERNIQRVKFSREVDRVDLERGVPTECIKREIANGIMESIIPFIEFDFSDNLSDLTRYGGRVYSGTLYVATGDRRYE